MKLNYLLSQRDPQLSQETVTRLMGESLRGELTITAADPAPGGAGAGSGIGGECGRGRQQQQEVTFPTPRATTLSGLIMQNSLETCPEAVYDSVEQVSYVSYGRTVTLLL